MANYTSLNYVNAHIYKRNLAICKICKITPLGSRISCFENTMNFVIGDMLVFRNTYAYVVRVLDFFREL